MSKSPINIDKTPYQELLTLVRNDQNNLGYVYKQSKTYCLSFLRKRNFKLREEDLEDIYQDAIMDFYEKIVNDLSFELTASPKTYLSSMCYFKLLKKADKTDPDFDFDTIKEIVKDKPDYDQSEEELYMALEKALITMKNGGGNCYELLTLFWYHKKSMQELTEIFGYTNAANTKNQKAKCQKRLKKIAYEQLSVN